AAVTWSTARSNAGSFTRDGRFTPLSFRTNWRAAARTSSSLAGGAKLARGLMLRHIARLLQRGQVLAQAVERLLSDLDRAELLDDPVALRGRGEERPHGELSLAVPLDEGHRHVELPRVVVFVPAVVVDEPLGWNDVQVG